MNKRFLSCAGLAVSLLIAGCTLGPDFHPPAAPSVSTFTKEPLPARTESAPVGGGEAQHFATGTDIPGEWWTLFHSDALNALVTEVLKTNPTLTAAQASLRAAMENVRAQVALYQPQITANLGASSNRQSAALSPVLNSNALLYSL